MSDEKKYTERELVLEQRGAFQQGATWQRMWERGNLPPGCRLNLDEELQRAFPLPRVHRQRRVTSKSTGWSYQLWPNGDGIVVWDSTGREVHDMGNKVDGIPLIDVPLVNDLLARPTEEVEDES